MKTEGIWEEKERCLLPKIQEKLPRQTPILLRAWKSFLRKAVLGEKGWFMCGQPVHSKCKPVYSRTHPS